MTTEYVYDLNNRLVEMYAAGQSLLTVEYGYDYRRVAGSNEVWAWIESEGVRQQAQEYLSLPPG